MNRVYKVTSEFNFEQNQKCLNVFYGTVTIAVQIIAKNATEAVAKLYKEYNFHAEKVAQRLIEQKEYNDRIYPDQEKTILYTSDELLENIHIKSLSVVEETMKVLE